MLGSTDITTFEVASIASPFSSERKLHTFKHGKTVFEVVDKIVDSPEMLQFVHVHIGGHLIDPNMWHVVKPKLGHPITLRVVPQGGDGKSPLNLVLSIALMAVAPQIGFGLAQGLGLGWTTAGGTFIASSMGLAVSNGIVAFAGRALINAIAPPSKPKSNRNGSIVASDPTTLFISGARNAVAKFGTIPRILGRHRTVPPQAKPYTETVGDDQYVRQLFFWSYGEVLVEDLKIGETLLSEFNDVEIETVYGTDSDPDITLYTNSVRQNDLNVELTQAGGYETRTTEPNTDEISIDITLPRGLVGFDDQGERITRSVRIEVQHTPTGTTDWTAGVTSYEASASDTIAVLDAGIYKPFHDTIPIDYNRIDVIVLDKATGVSSILLGSPIPNYLATPTFTPPVPTAPPVPSNKILLAEVSQLGGVFTVTDKRYTALFGEEFETSADFLVTGSSSPVSVASGGLKHLGIKITDRKTSAVRRNIRFQVANGQYDVRVRRTTADSDSDKIFDETSWTTLRSVEFTPPVNRTGLAMTAIRIKASGQLNGALDQLNGIITSVVPDWDGISAWTDNPTSNPASLFREVLQGSANAKALDDGRINLTVLQSWHDDCRLNSRRYDRVINEQTSLQEILHDIASAGRASPSLIDGLWGVVLDRSQTVPTQHFTPVNSYDFSADRVYPEQPHALRVQFINEENGWNSDEMIVYDDGFDEDNAIDFEGLSLSGITNPDQIWKDARYHMSASRLRPETYTFSVDVEHLVCTRGDLILFTHDIPLFGIMSGRVSSVTDDGTNVTHVTLNAEVTMEADAEYSARFRLSDGDTAVQSVVAVAGASTVIEFVTPPLIADAPVAGDLFMFGAMGSETVELIIKSVIPSGDLTAKLTCVDASPAIHTADTGLIPDFDSQITVPLELTQPSAPILSSIQSGEEVLVVNPDGGITSRIVVNMEDVNSRIVEPIVIVRHIDATEFSAVEFNGDNRSVSIYGLQVGQTYDIDIKYKTVQSGMLSKSLIITNHLFTGDTNPPDDVLDFDIDIQGQTTNLSWTPNTEYDLSHYAVRFTNALTGATWGTSLPLNSNVSKTSNSLSINSAIGTYLIKAVDRGGRESINEKLIVTNIGELDALNVVSTVTESTAFSGVHNDTENDGGVLTLKFLGEFDDQVNIDLVTNVDAIGGTVTSTGTYEFDNDLDLGAVYTSKLTAEISAFGQDVSIIFDDFANIDLVDNVDGSADPSLWAVKLQVRFTEDDPSASPTWSAWQDFIVGDYTARAFEWRLKMSSFDLLVQPRVTLLSVTIDMPDRSVGQEDLSSLAGSVLTVTHPNGSFRESPALAIASQDMATGDYFTITGKTSASFGIRFFDSGGSTVIRTFDYVAKGFGKIII